MAISITKHEADKADNLAWKLEIGDDGSDSNGRHVTIDITMGELRLIRKALDWLTACYTPGAKKVGI